MGKKIEVQIVGDASSLRSAFRSAGDESGKFGSILGGLGKAAVGVGAVLGGALAVGAKVGFDEFVEGQKVAAQTAAVLKSTGGAARVTAGQVAELSEALMKKSGVDDEAIQSGANLLLTFTRVRNEVGKGNDVFNQATRAALDMSVAMGSDMTSASMLVGKALNDPIKGMAALSRAGVQFTADQRAAITAMVESGNAMGAQKIILKELETQFGGSAAAAGQTFGGQMAIAKETLSNFAGEVVGAAVPALAALVTKAVEVLPSVIAFGEGLLTRVRPAIQLVSQFISGNFIPIIGQLREIFQTAMARIAAVVGSHGPEIRQIFANLGSVIRDVGAVVIPILRFALEEVLPRAIGVLIPVLVGVTTVMRTVATAVRGIADRVGDVIGAFGDLKGWAGAQLAAIRDSIVGKFNAMLGPIQAVISAIERVIGVARDAIHWVQKIPGVGGVDVPFFGGGRAAGGPVDAFTSYVVGERGPELFTPGRSGMITANRALAGAGAGGGRVDIHFHGGTFIGGSPEGVARELAGPIRSELAKISNRQGTSWLS